MNVLYTFDTKFWRMAAVSIDSLMRNHSHPNSVTIYCMVAPHTRGRAKISQIVQSYGGELVWRPIRNFKNPFRRHTFRRWSPVIYYRLFAHRIFPDLDRILYLDSDTLVLGDLTELYQTDISKHTMAAVCDMAPINITPIASGRYVQNFIKTYLKHNLYVNSGVLLINLKQMSRYDDSFQNADIPLQYPDQDLINYCLDGDILRLPLRYNFTTSIDGASPYITHAEYADAQSNTMIYHFYAIKPYIYHLTPRNIYQMFTSAAQQIGFYPPDFYSSKKRHHNRRTGIFGLRLHRGKTLRFFGIKM